MINWLKNFFKSKEEKVKLPFKVDKNGNNTSLYDQKTVNYFESKLPNPTQKEFSKLIGNSIRIIISKREVKENSNILIPIEIYRITDSKVIEDVKLKLKILDESKGHLMCIGDYLFDFYDKEGNVIQLEYLGSGHIRIEKTFKTDAELKEPIEFMNWLKSIGISEPLNNWVEEEKRRKENERRFLEWKLVAPNALIKNLDSINQNPFGRLDENIFKELKHEIPNEKKLILKLFKLFGIGFNSWNGFPVYESIPSNILMGRSIETLNSAFETEDLDKEQKEGMARFLSSWDFTKKRKSDIKKVSDKVKNRLFAHLEEMRDKRKIEQFKTRVKK